MYLLYIIYSTKLDKLNQLDPTKVISHVQRKKISIAKKKFTLGKNVRIKYVKDRPGHDLRYALNSNKIKKKLNWKPNVNTIDGLNKTFLWYLENSMYFKNLKKTDMVKRLGNLND